MRLDLHLHTTASDGAWSPADVVRGAVEGRLDVIAITDHDTTAGVAPARAAAAGERIQVVSGVEMSSAWSGRDIHILGYFVDPDAPSLRDHAARASGHRDNRMKEMVDRLVTQGVEVTFDDVERMAGPEREMIGRPHLARALVEAGAVGSVHEAFRTLIGDDHDAFVPAHLLVPEEAVELILAAGGIPVWAHPPSDLVDTLLPGLRAAGLEGVEVYRARTKRADVLRLEQICRTTGLLPTGGSDWHGPEGGSALGDFFLNADEVEGLLRRGGI